jgi:2,3-bisphosphoglycerate-dependent phosphoglycerate mutase
MASAHLLLPLTETGREQARQAAQTVHEWADRSGLEIDPLIEASQLLRASETARIIASELGRLRGASFDVEDRDEMLERSLGSCANLRLDEISRLLAADPRLSPLPEGWRRTPDFRLPVPGAESLMQAGARTAARIDASLDTIPADDTRDILRLFVAHSGCLRHAAVVKQALEADLVSGITMDFAQSIFVERLSDGSWKRIEGEWKKRDTS